MAVALVAAAPQGFAQDVRLAGHEDDIHYETGSSTQGSRAERENGLSREIKDDDEDAAASGVTSLGRVAWILVIQATRGPKGEMIPWERASPWASIWRVPGDIKGTKYVPVSGDADDREHVKPADLNHLQGLSFLASKYGAPAVAIVVREPNGIAVAGWRGGSSSGWSRQDMSATASTEDAKTASVKLLADIFPNKPLKNQDEMALDKSAAHVLAFRDAGNSMQYQIIVQGRTSSQSLQHMIEGISGLSISEIRTLADGYDIVVNDTSGATVPIERRLSQAGLPTTGAAGASAQR